MGSSPCSLNTPKRLLVRALCSDVSSIDVPVLLTQRQQLSSGTAGRVSGVTKSWLAAAGQRFELRNCGVAFQSSVLHSQTAALVAAALSRSVMFGVFMVDSGPTVIASQKVQTPHSQHRRSSNVTDSTDLRRVTPSTETEPPQRDDWDRQYQKSN